MATSRSKAYAAKAGMVLLALACVPILGYLLLLGASNVYVSGGLAGGPRNLVDNNIVWPMIRDAGRSLPWLPQPGVTHVERIDAFNALRNLAFIFCLSGLTALLLVLMFVAGVAKAITGLFTGNWASFGIGILMAVLTPIFAIGFILFAFFVWVSLLFQPCTPAYAILWILLGLPLFVVGAPSGATPFITVIVIVRN